MPVAYNPTPIDFSALAGIGENIGQGYKNKKLNDVIAGSMKDGVFDYGFAVDALAKGGFGPEALKLAIAKQEADALAGYRSGQLGVAQQNAVPDDLQLLDWAKKNNYIGSDASAAEPSYLSPPDPVSSAPSGSPGVSYAQASGLENAPALLQRKLATEQQQEQWKAEGKGAGERAAQRAKKVEYGANVEASINDLIAQVDGMDDASFENALGPWQGSGGTDTLSAAAAFVPQTFGAAVNAIPGLGGKESTSEVRSAIIGSTEALATAIKPFVRAPGEGTWTDDDQARLVSIVGDLQFSKDKAEFKRRLRGVVSRVKASFGLDVNIDFNKGKDQGRLGDEPMDMAEDGPSASFAPQPHKVQTVPIAPPTQAGAVQVPGATRDPNGPYLPQETPLPPVQKGSQEERQMLKWAQEAIDGGADRAAVVQRLQELGVGP